ncbi:MAG TPA: hypothetical protein VGG84_01330 [Gemmatimonadaceae bacterium]
MSERFLRGACGAALLILAGACSEQVTSSAGCPQLCSDQSAPLKDTLLTAAVAFDTTVTGFPLLGETREISLVARGDTADVRAVTRFDSLPSLYVPTTAQPDSLIKVVDSATFIFVIDTAFVKPTIPLTVDAFDVDTSGVPDTVPTTLVPLFRSDRFLGSATYQVADLVKDTLRLPLDNAALLRKISAKARLRIGLRVRAAQSVTLRLSGTNFAPRVRFRVSPDTAIKPDTVTLLSKTPTDDATLAASLAMYPVLAAGVLPPPPAERVAVGGIGGARGFLRFDIPDAVLTSVQVVRASLELTQTPSRSHGGESDTLLLIPHAVVAGPAVMNVFTQSQFLAAIGQFGLDTVRLVPKDSGQRSIELVNLVRAWQAVGTANTTRALVLRSKQEASSPGELNFFSTKGPVAARPRLRVTYVPRRDFGIP